MGEIDTQELEAQGTESQQVDLPANAGGVTPDRAEQRAAALEEAAAAVGGETSEETSQAVIEELSSKEGEITIEDLRKLPGADKFTDEQLKEQWDKAVEAEKPYKIPFPVYDAAGNKIEALDKFTLQDLLDGKVKLGYTAFDKEQRKTLAEALRNASMGHWNEQKYNTALEERNRVSTELSQKAQRLETLEQQQRIWDAALSALVMGNTQPMQQLANALANKTVEMPQNVPGYVPEAQAQAERQQMEAGMTYIQNTLIPAGLEIAQNYGADTKEVLDLIEHLLQKEPQQFLTEEKIQNILKYDVPMVLEQAGYTSAGGVNRPQINGPSNEIEELKKTVAALQSSIADKKNAQVEAVRNRQKKFPPAGGGSTPGAGDSMPSFKSRSQMKAWMQGDENWAKN